MVCGALRSRIRFLTWPEAYAKLYSVTLPIRSAVLSGKVGSETIGYLRIPLRPVGHPDASFEVSAICLERRVSK